MIATHIFFDIYICNKNILCILLKTFVYFRLAFLREVIVSVFFFSLYPKWVLEIKYFILITYVFP